MLDFRLTVEERDGDKFKGEITLADGRTKYNFEGAIKNNKVRFRSEKKGFYNMTWVGELKAGELKLSFSGTNPVGTSVSGAAYLKEE